MIQSLVCLFAFLFSNTVSNSDYTVLIESVTMNNELKRTRSVKRATDYSVFAEAPHDATLVILSLCPHPRPGFTSKYSRNRVGQLYPQAWVLSHSTTRRPRDEVFEPVSKRSPYEVNNFLFSTSSIPVLGSTKPPANGHQWLFPRCEAIRA
jgi:hypothetical protein